MIARIRHIARLLPRLIFAGTMLFPAFAPAQPLRHETPDNPCLGGRCPKTHPIGLFGMTEREGFPVYDEVHKYGNAYRTATDGGDYQAALAYADSLIRLAGQYPQADLEEPEYHKDRAAMLLLLNREEEACTAYERAVKVQDSLLHREQSQAVREMQTSYELDRLALNQALQSARNHQATLILVILLILVELIVIAFIYKGNRRMKQLQTELIQQIKQARESEQKKADFINSMCHEVRTPLNSISGFGELLCSPDLTPEAQTEYCDIIQNNRRQLRYLFDDMLEVAYLEGLQEELPGRYVDICALCRSQLRVMKVRFPKPGVTYSEIIPAENIGINANEKYLITLLTALLNNAYKFTHEGTVRIECGRKGSYHIFIAVADTGCGIPRSKHELVFERFTKLDTFSPGNGLGLYLCKLIVKHLHGEISIDPYYTEGTRVVVVLPRKAE